MGRPANADLDDPAVVEAICDRLIAGKSMADICKDADMPAESTVYLKMAKDEAFRSAIARARELQQDAEIDRTIDMADAATGDDWQVVKLRIWARQWRAMKLSPKKYGDATTVKHADADGGKIELDDVTRAARLAALAAQINAQRPSDNAAD